MGRPNTAEPTALKILFSFLISFESMDSSNPSSAVPSRGSTPKLATSSRFTSQNATAEDLLKSQTIGLVQLSDFRKRRAEALEVKEREGLERSSGIVTPASGASTPIDG